MTSFENLLLSPRFFLFLYSSPILLLSVVFLAVLGQGQQDHCQLLLADFAISIEVAAAQNRLFKIQKILGVVILQKGRQEI